MSEPTVGKLDTLRVQTLADGIFAIAMTLLVFEIHLPTTHPTEAAELPAALLLLWPRFASFGVGFLTLGFSWIGHHNQYAWIRRVDRRFLWINILFFLFIALVPFTSALLGEFPFEQLSVVLYAGNLVLAGICLYAHWWYAAGRGRLVDAATPAEVVSATGRRILLAPAAYGVAMALAFVEVRLALAICIAVPAYFMLGGKVDRQLAR